MDINEVAYTDNLDIARSGEAFWFDDDKGQGLVDEIWIERKHQIEVGYTHEHDDEHGLAHIIGWATAYTEGAKGGNMDPAMARHGLIQSIALLVAAVETMDRQTDA